MRYAFRLSSLVLIALAAACGGSSPTAPPVAPPPPPPPPPPSPQGDPLTLRDTSALQFTGTALGARVFAAQGSPRILSAPAGWLIQQETLLVAPSTDARGTVVLATVSDTAALTLTASIDLRAHRWQVSGMCVPRPRLLLTASGVFIDSLFYDHVAIDSVIYAGDASWIRNFGGVAQAWYSGDLIFWLAGKDQFGPRPEAPAVDTVSVTADSRQFAEQRPDTLMIRRGVTGPVAPMVRIAPLTYVGGDWCGGEETLWRTRGPARMEAIP